MALHQKGRIQSGEIEIYYEAFGDPANPAVLLISGMDDLCTCWYPGFCNPLIDAGYYVIRFDNRDCGMSTWITDWDLHHPYTLYDMTKDTVALLDALYIEMAHIVGASMGGMIAQETAIHFPKRVLTLTSIASSGFPLDPDIAHAPGNRSVTTAASLEDQYPDRLTDFHQAVEYRMAACRCFAGNRFEIAEDLLREILEENILKRNGYNPVAGVHQSAAITAAGSRLDSLFRIRCPALVIHGTQDPLLDHRHAVKYADRIPGARLVLLEGIGHEIPPGIINQVQEEMFRLFSRAHFY